MPRFVPVKETYLNRFLIKRYVISYLHNWGLNLNNNTYSSSDSYSGLQIKDFLHECEA